VLRRMVEAHLTETESRPAADILRNWSEELPGFWQVCPKELIDKLDHPLTERADRVSA